MTITATDLFCGAGGSSLGARHAGVELVIAANHWQTAIDVHQAHFPDAAHDCADISQADPRRYPRTDVLLASPECTNHSQARGVSRKRQDPTLWDAPDPAAERSRATMWDVVRFAEQMLYDAIVVENVVEATKWIGWRAWHLAMADLGYQHQVLSINSQDHGVAQSRDRIYVVFWRAGIHMDLELERRAHCPRCDLNRPVRQAWKNGRTVGRYRQQWVWACTTCGSVCEPDKRPAADIIDWTLPCPRIGDRKRPLAKATRARILAGLQRYGWAPVVTAGAGHVYETTPGNRARPTSDPLATQGTTAQHALAVGPDELIVTNRTHHTPRTAAEPLTTLCTGNHHGLLVRSYGFAGSGSMGRFTSSSEDPLPTLVTTQRPALLMRNNQGGAEMCTPVAEPARTITTAGHQSLLVPYNGRGQAKPDSEPLGTQPATDRWSLVDPDQVVDDCGFRMLEPHEIAAAMAFPDGYIPDDLTKKDRVKLAGNAVTPPVEHAIVARVAAALEAAR